MDGGVAVRSLVIAQRFVGHMMTAAPSAVMPWAVSGYLAVVISSIRP